MWLVLSLHWTGGESLTPADAYDGARNRTAVQVTQWPFGGCDQVNDRSWAYGYDGLRRLVAADTGQLSGDLIGPGCGSPAMRQITWALDNLGNWSGDSVNYRSVVREDDTDGDGQADETRTIHHDVDAANQVDAVVADPGSGPGTQFQVHDAIGNLIFDGSYWYHYDAWNRLIQVYEAGTLTVADFDRFGRLVGQNDPGLLVAEYAYDGLGRLIRREGPIDEDQPDDLVTEDYYYDGVRRVQTVVYTPLRHIGGGGLFGEFFGFGGGAGWSEREYVYGPDYVDEFVLQVNAGRVAYMLQDANYNVAALLNTAGSVLEQYAYEPYGELVAVDSLVPNPPKNRVGHHGLFFERLDAPMDYWPLVPPDPNDPLRPSGVYQSVEKRPAARFPVAPNLPACGRQARPAR